MYSIRTILHPTDFSPQAERAFDLACQWAKSFGARVVVLHVGVPPLTMLGGAEALPPAAEEVGAEELRRNLHRVQATVEGVPVEHVLAIGDAPTEIVRVAAEKSVDLIVMGTQGRRGVERLLLGSVAEGVLRKATCPVTTCK